MRNTIVLRNFMQNELVIWLSGGSTPSLFSDLKASATLCYTSYSAVFSILSRLLTISLKYGQILSIQSTDIVFCFIFLFGDSSHDFPHFYSQLTGMSQMYSGLAVCELHQSWDSHCFFWRYEECTPWTSVFIIMLK